MGTRDYEFAKLKNSIKNITIYESTKEEINPFTGELLSKTTEKINKVSTEPEFIKLYYETMMAFNKIHNVPISFLVSLSKFIEWSNEGKSMCITLNKRVKDILQKDCGVKLAQISRYIAISVENGLLFKTKYRGVYEVNPFMIAKGKWDSIRNLRCKFNFKNGKWVREIEEISEDEKAEKNDESLQCV